MTNKQTMELITNQVVEAMETNKAVLWSKPWHNVKDGAFNRITKKPYSLLNQLMLFPYTGEFATFKQWSGLGGKIKKGEKSRIVCFWKPNTVELKDSDGNVVTDENGETQYNTYFILKYYRVFHISQVEGVEPLPADERPNTQFVDIVDAEKVIDDYSDGAELAIHKQISNRAFYSPSDDSITLPLKTQFDDESEYYSTAFHECVHSTGAKNRLNRDTLVNNDGFGHHEYSKEELVAELGAWYLCSLLGIDNTTTKNQSEAYLISWLKALKKDTSMLVSAATKAQKAVEYMLSFKTDEATTPDDKSGVVIPDSIRYKKLDREKYPDMFDLQGIKLEYDKSITVDVLPVDDNTYAVINTDFERATDEYYDKVCTELWLDNYTDLDDTARKNHRDALRKSHALSRKGFMMLDNGYIVLMWTPYGKKKSLRKCVMLENANNTIAVYDVKKGA